MSSTTTKKRAAAAAADSLQGETKDGKEDAFEIMMDATRRISSQGRKRIKPTTHQNSRNKLLPAQEEPANALDRLMSTARCHKPYAFCPYTSDQDILGYINRHPEWRIMISELIQQEKEKQQQAQEEEKDDYWQNWHDFDEEENEKIRDTLYSMESSLRLRWPTLANSQEQQIWQVEDLHHHQQQYSLQSARRNGRISPPPTRPNEDSVLIGVHVHFGDLEGEIPYYAYTEGKTVMCGWTLIYDDHVELSFDIAESSSNSSSTDGDSSRISSTRTIVKVQLQTNEHIQAIGTYASKFLTQKRIGFLTTKNRWLIASNGKLTEESKWKDNEKLKAPEGEIIQYFEIDTCDSWTSRLRKVLSVTTIPLDKVNGRRSGVPSLSTVCEEKLERYLKESSSDASKEAYTKLEKIWWDEDDWDFHFDYQLQLQESPEAETMRSLVLLKRVATNRFETKFHTLLHKAKLKQQKTIQATQSKAEESCKIPCRQEQNRIYEHHMAFLETKARLSMEDNNYDYGDDTTMIDTTGSSKKVLCIFPQCRKIYLPRNLPLSKRCIAEDCGTAFEMCGCMIKICPKCFESFCPWHIEEHRNAPCHGRRRRRRPSNLQ